MCAEAVQCAIFLVVCYDSFTFTVFHDQVESKVFNEVVGVVPERLPVQCMQKSVARSVCSCTATICLTSFPVFLGLSAESSLVAREC